jgi:hypothetical protein
MSGKAEGRAPGGDDRQGSGGQESLDDVLASIRSLVSAESRARQAPEGDIAEPLVLTPAMRAVDPPARNGEILTEGMDMPGAPHHAGAPILDEEALRAVVNAIVREELQGELGDRISRNLRKLIRRELSQALEPPRED